MEPRMRGRQSTGRKGAAATSEEVGEVLLGGL